MTPILYTPVCLGGLALEHRVIMAPLTRLRASQPGNVPTSLMSAYYGQRASEGGLIISEATQVVPEGQGYPSSPGIHSPEQVAGWRAVTDAVHSKGGLVVLQLWHVGRISHSSHQPVGGRPVAPSAVPAAGDAYTANWTLASFETPRALNASELPGVVESFRRGAENAMAAGFDGVEVHAANGYLLDQFLQDRTNRRDEAYGGPVERRARLPLEVVDAVASVWGPDRVGVRLSPYGTFNDIGDTNPAGLFTHIIEALSARGLAYLHLVEPRASEASGSGLLDEAAPVTAPLFRRAFRGAVISAGGFTRETAERAVEAGTADAVAFGRAFIANPDLPVRLRERAPLNPYDRSTFYGGERGYADCPALSGTWRAVA